MWQAQLRGNKSWTLAPTPECDADCKSFSFYVEPGDTGKFKIHVKFSFCINLMRFHFRSAVLIDTRVWYHGTTISKNEFSLAIQSEYG